MGIRPYAPQAALQSAAARVPIAGMVAGDYGTEPVLYSQAEFAQLAKTLQDLPGRRLKFDDVKEKRMVNRMQGVLVQRLEE